MRLNAKRPSSVHVTKLNVLSFLTPVYIVFSIQTHITEKHNLNMFKAKHVKKVSTISYVFRKVFKF